MSQCFARCEQNACDGVMRCCFPLGEAVRKLVKLFFFLFFVRIAFECVTPASNTLGLKDLQYLLL